MIKDRSDGAKERNKNGSHDAKFVWRVRGQSKKWAATYQAPKADPSIRSQLNHTNKVYRKLQQNQELKSKSMPDMNILYTNTDQVKTIKKLDLLELVE